MVEMKGRKPDGRCCVSSHRFVDHSYRSGDRPQGFEVESYILGHILRGHNPDVFRRDEPIDSLDGLPKEGVFPDDLKHLLGAGFPAQGPETSPGAAGKDNDKRKF